MITALTMTSALTGPDPVPITADDAFDAVMTGIDPITGVNYGVGNVVIVDVRTPPEYQFRGTAGKVDSILLKDTSTTFVPDLGKIKFIQEGRFLEYTVGGKKEKIQIDKAAKLISSSIAVNIPCATWNQFTKEMALLNVAEALADEFGPIQHPPGFD